MAAGFYHPLNVLLFTFVNSGSQNGCHSSERHVFRQDMENGAVSDEGRRPSSCNRISLVVTTEAERETGTGRKLLPGRVRG